MTILTLTAQNFDQTVQDNEITVVDFWASWCGPCLAFSPIFDQVAAQHPDVLFAKVDIDEEKSLAADFNVLSIPFIMIFRREFALFAQPGVQTATTLNELIHEAKQVDLAALRQQINPSKE